MANRTVATEITKWQGINVLPNVNITENCTEQQVNFRINADGSIATREGSKLEVDFSVPTAMVGLTEHHLGIIHKVWHGHIGGNDVVVVLGNLIYAVYTVGSDDSLTLAATHAHPFYEATFEDYNEIFEFDKKTYLIAGRTFYIFNKSTYALSAAALYVPTISITTPPAGGGELYESINIMTAKRKILYSTVNGTSSFVLPEKAQSINSATLNGTALESTDITFTSDSDTFTCSAAGSAASGINNFEIEYTCTVDTYNAQRGSLPMQLRPIKFAGTTDTQVFYYEGNTAFADYNPKNIVYYSDIGEAGADPTYIAAENYVTVGDSSPITDAVRLYNRLLIFTKTSTWYIGYTEVTLDEVTKQAYTVNSLHDGIGCYVPHTALLLDNVAATATDKAMYLWTSTKVKDERNATIASQPVEGVTDAWGASSLVTLDDDYHKEAWFAKRVSGTDKAILVYNYSVGAWYRFEIKTGTDGSAIGGLLMINKQPAFYTAAGLYVLNEAYDVDDKGVSDTPINATAKFRPFYFGRPEFHKNCYRYFITAKPKIPSESIPNPALTVFVSSDNTPYAASITHVIALSNTTDMSRVDFAGETIRRRCHYRRFYSIQMSITANSPIVLKKIRFDGEITDSLVGG